MIIFLYGPDEYRRVQKKKELIAEFQKKRSALGLDVFDFEVSGELERLQGFLRNQSIFESAKLAIIDNAFELDAPKLAKFLQPLVEQKGVQLLISEKDKPVKALAFLLEKPVLSQKFEHLEGAEWLSFVREEAKKNNVTLGVTAAQFLAIVYQNNEWGVATEIQKLSGLKSTIEKSDLDAFGLEAAPNYWGLINGLKSWDVKNRLYAFEKMLAVNDPPAKIFNILASQWAEKTPHMAVYDLAIKSGKLDYEEALTDLLIS